jgi:hypothetical protein
MTNDLTALCGKNVIQKTVADAEESDIFPIVRCIGPLNIPSQDYLWILMCFVSIPPSLQSPLCLYLIIHDKIQIRSNEISIYPLQFDVRIQHSCSTTEFIIHQRSMQQITPTSGKTLSSIYIYPSTEAAQRL